MIEIGWSAGAGGGIFPYYLYAGKSHSGLDTAVFRKTRYPAFSGLLPRRDLGRACQL